MPPRVPHTEHFQAQHPAKTVPPHAGPRRAPPLKKIMLAVAVSVLAVLMVLPVVRFVNVSAGDLVKIDRTLYADGAPLPPRLAPKPPSVNAGTLVADGGPLPPPIPPLPPPVNAGTLVADGGPLPPPIPPLPPPVNGGTLGADGGPLPPPIPPLPPQSTFLV